MEKIYSKVEPTRLLHIVVRKEDLQPGRINIIEPDQFLQCAGLNFERERNFKPHAHFRRNRPAVDNYIPQESWVVIQGRVQCIFYDLGDAVISTPILNPGDASFTLEGGHTYIILEDNTLVYEYKTGPYQNQEDDKFFIDKFFDHKKYIK